MRIRSNAREDGFTLVELAVVVLVLGILVGIAIPLYAQTQALARKRACFSNQRNLEGAAQAYAAQNFGTVSALAGEVNSAHPLMNTVIFKRPPRCSVAPVPADMMNPDAAHGAYTMDATGNVLPCAFGGHAHYSANN